MNLKIWWTQSISRQLMLGIALVHALLMSIFVFDLVQRQRHFLLDLSQKQAVGLAKTLATNGSSWLLADDFIGIEEVIKSQSDFPGLRYALFTNLNGYVLGYTDTDKVGKYLQDEISKTILDAPPVTQRLIDSEYLIDVAAPMYANQKHIGWARVGISRANILANLDIVTRDGIVYTFLAIFIGLLFAWFMAQGLTQPIRKLINNLTQVQQGKRDTNLILDRADEIGVFSQHLSRTVIALNQTETELQQSLEDQQLTIDELQQMQIEMIHKQQQIQQLNEELETKVLARTEALNQTNQELTEFAYVVSHDLKAPLRAINQLSGWIEEDYALAFDDEGREQMALLRSRARRMHNMIDAILDYSRIGRVEQSYETVDLNQLLAEVVDIVVPPLHIKVDIQDDLPMVLANKVSLFQVLQNLLDNAVKYNDKKAGLIEFSCEQRQNDWYFCVQDNGIGIDTAHQQKVFQLFQTLQPKDQQDNTGVGLSLIKKSILNWGGKIVLESELGQGCQFCFSLPKVPHTHE